MSQWPAAKARRVLNALLQIGRLIKRQSGSQKTLAREGWPDFVFAFHDRDEIGPRMLARFFDAHLTEFHSLGTLQHGIRCRRPDQRHRNLRNWQGIRELPRLRKFYGRGRWRQRKGVATVRLPDGSERLAELRWYEATGIGRKKF